MRCFWPFGWFIASGSTRHPGETLGEWQGSASWVVGGEKDKAKEKTGLDVARL